MTACRVLRYVSRKQCSRWLSDTPHLSSVCLCSTDFNICTTLSTCPLLAGWYGSHYVAVTQFYRTNTSNSDAMNWGSCRRTFLLEVHVEQRVFSTLQQYETQLLISWKLPRTSLKCCPHNNEIVHVSEHRKIFMYSRPRMSWICPWHQW